MRRTRARLPWLVLLIPGLAHGQPVDAPPGDAPVVDAPPPVADPPPPPPPESEPEKNDKKKDKDKDKDKADESVVPADSIDATAAPDSPKKKKDKYVPEISGYVQVRYQNPIDTNDDNDVAADSFRIERARVKVNGKIRKHVGYSVEFDPSVDDAADVLRDAYIWFKYIPHHELRVGQQKTQFGYENVTSSTKLFWVNRSEVSESLSRGKSLRDIGLGLIGELTIGGGFSVEDAVTVVNGAGANVQSDDTEMKNVWGRIGGRYQSVPLDLDVRIGVSGAFGDQFDPGVDLMSPIDDVRFDFRRIGTDLHVDHTYFYLAAEYVWGKDIDQDTDASADAHGYYVGAAGKTPWKVGPILRYDAFTNTFDQTEKRYTFGAYYGGKNAALRAMINYEHRVDRDDRMILWGQATF